VLSSRDLVSDFHKQQRRGIRGREILQREGESVTASLREEHDDGKAFFGAFKTAAPRRMNGATGMRSTRLVCVDRFRRCCCFAR